MRLTIMGFTNLESHISVQSWHSPCLAMTEFAGMYGSGGFAGNRNHSAMQMNYLFRNPSGREVRSSDLNLVREHILHPSERYWCTGSGQASFEVKVNADTATLSLLFKETNGFLLQYGIYDSTDDFVSICSKDYSKTIGVYVGGDLWTVPVGFFVSPEMAGHAVAEFCASGSMSTMLTWGKLAEQHWESGT